MAALYREFAGAEREFRLRLGDILDLEEACGKVGIGAIYLRLAGHQYFIRDIQHTIRLALIGGGLPATEAGELVRQRLDAGLLVELQGLAVDILVARFAGLEPEQSDTEDAGEPVPLDADEILSSLLQLGLSPEQVRAMDYDDFRRLCRATGRGQIAPPSDEEFRAMIAQSRAIGT